MFRIQNSTIFAGEPVLGLSRKDRAWRLLREIAILHGYAAF